MNAVQALKSFFSAVVKWLSGMTALWLIIIGFLIVLGPLFSSCLEQRIRLTGMLLQLLGVFVVALGLNDTRRAFNDLPTVWQRIKRAWGARPSWPRGKVQFTAANLVGGGALIGSPRLRQNPNPQMSIDQRVGTLEKQYTAVLDEVDKLSGEINKKLEEIAAKLEIEHKEREDGDAGIKAQLKKAIGEGIPLQALGALFFAIGIAAATMSLEFAGGVGCQ